MEGDIFLGKAASIGKIAMVNVNFEFSIWSPLALLRPNNKIMQSKFLEYVLKSDYSIYEILQILSVSAFDKTPIRNLLTMSKVNQNIKELQYNLFDDDMHKC